MRYKRFASGIYFNSGIFVLFVLFLNLLLAIFLENLTQDEEKDLFDAGQKSNMEMKKALQTQKTLHQKKYKHKKKILLWALKTFKALVRWNADAREKLKQEQNHIKLEGTTFFFFDPNSSFRMFAAAKQMTLAYKIFLYIVLAIKRSLFNASQPYK